MKKIILAMFAIATCLTAQAQQSDSIFNEFKTAKDAEYVLVDQNMLNASKEKGLNVMDGKIQLGGEIPKNISSIQVLSLGKCSKKVREAVFDRVNSLKDKGYEELVSVMEGDSKVLILSRAEGDNIVEMLIYGFDKEDNDCALVQFRGSIKKKELEKMMQGGH
ncbi:DUF4252 domain-containing protein [Prevotella sp. KH2C16]|uniref:DUF4252 domain-containing protein n=1 Tax=Prevotella sp. KH2C16 TaxID=1855325 RepID=UPI0008F175D2|nr:DUF4252 domain-containing protein [Prevotella sp. KH2C16]SFF84691.1 protein of unknown function [Prevotella sp. KH2C16]